MRKYLLVFCVCLDNNLLTFGLIIKQNQQFKDLNGLSFIKIFFSNISLKNSQLSWTDMNNLCLFSVNKKGWNLGTKELAVSIFYCIL